MAKAKKYNHQYKLIWKLDRVPIGVTQDKIPPGYGGCDAVLFCSVMYPPDGSFSLYFIGVDGRKPKEMEGTLEDIEWFKVWALMAKRLANSKTLAEDRRKFAEDIWNLIREAVWGGPERERGW